MKELNNIYNEDCLEGMKEIPDKSIDLICIDPPYIISRNTGFICNQENETYTKKYNIHYQFGDWDTKELNLDGLLTEFYRILKDNGTLLMFYDKWKMQELKENAEAIGFKQPRLCVWNKTNPVPINSKVNYLTNASEYFCTFVKKNKPTFNSEYDNGIYTYPICHGKERTKHPTQKPLDLMDALIVKHSNENEVVLDCFMGSGSTIVSCIRNNRQFIGFELDPEYFYISMERIKQNKENNE